MSGRIFLTQGPHATKASTFPPSSTKIKSQLLEGRRGASLVCLLPAPSTPDMPAPPPAAADLPLALLSHSSDKSFFPSQSVSLAAKPTCHLVNSYSSSETFLYVAPSVSLSQPPCASCAVWTHLWILTLHQVIVTLLMVMCLPGSWTRLLCPYVPSTNACHAHQGYLVAFTELVYPPGNKS